MPTSRDRQEPRTSNIPPEIATVAPSSEKCGIECLATTEATLALLEYVTSRQFPVLAAVSLDNLMEVALDDLARGRCLLASLLKLRQELGRNRSAERLHLRVLIELRPGRRFSAPVVDLGGTVNGEAGASTRRRHGGA